MTTHPHIAEQMLRAGQTAEAREMCAKLTEAARRRVLGRDA